MTELNIYQKMLKATEKINKVAKNLKVGVGQSQYKAVGEADVLEAVKPVEIELGIYSFPVSRKVIDTNVFTVKSEYQGKVTERNNIFLRLETVYRFVNVDNPTDFIDITTYGDGFDAQDKATGKAMTYSDKYALLKAYKIETGEDTDQHISEPISKVKPAPKEVKEVPATDEQVADIKELIDLTGADTEALLKHYEVSSLSMMTDIKANDCIKKLNQKLNIALEEAKGEVANENNE